MPKRGKFSRAAISRRCDESMHEVYEAKEMLVAMRDCPQTLKLGPSKFQLLLCDRLGDFSKFIGEA